MSAGYMSMLIVCGTIQAALLAVAIIYLWMVFATRHWLPTPGTVITSRVVSRRQGHGGTDTEIANTPLVEYEYQVNDKAFRSDRIMIGGGKSEVELESVLGRYPRGAQVTVFYNPADPRQAVLERRIPAARLIGGGILLLFPFALPLAAIQMYHYGADWFTALLIAAPYTVGFGGLALAVLGYATVLTGMAMRGSSWPTTRGQIVTAGEEEISTDNGSRFKPCVTFLYTVNGRKYKSGRVTMTVGFSSHISTLSRRTLAKYPVGTKVDVRYNPKWPSEAVLYPWSAGHIAPWVIAAGFIALAFALAPK